MIRIPSAPPDIDTVRTEFSHVGDVAYFNTGTFGTMADSVLQRVLDRIAYFEQKSYSVYHEILADVETVRQRLAARIGAEPTELTLTRNATDGVNLVAAGIRWQPGDEVIISDQEHPAMNYPWLWASQTQGVVVRRFRVSHDPAETLANAIALFSPKTRLIGASWITSPFGVRLPAQAICTAASERGILSLIDGAQAFAVIPVNVAELGCDFFTSNGHKWLGGPKGTGFFWARSDRLRELTPAHVGAGCAERFDVETGLQLWPDSRRFEFGTTAHTLWAGLGPALDWFDQLGWDWVESRTASLAEYLKRALTEIPGVHIKTPLAWERSSGLTTFALEKADAKDLEHYLAERWSVAPRSLGLPGHIRVSTAYFNTHAEIDRLIAGVRAYPR